MIWAVELGNTRTKVTSVGVDGEPVGPTCFFPKNDSTWTCILKGDFPIRIANTSGQPIPELPNSKVLQLADAWPFKLSCSPSIGIDRCLTVVGARSLHPHGPLAVISCGTCLTGTLLSDSNELLGGPISPGWTMRLQAMGHYAPSLPLVFPEQSPFTPQGTRSTESSMQQGAFVGMSAEIEYWVQAWQREFPGIQIFITGGDGPAFAKPFESGIFAASNLEARGLYAQYLYEKHP